jgi:hypothetical protein
LSNGDTAKKEAFKKYGEGGPFLIDQTPSVCPK